MKSPRPRALWVSTSLSTRGGISTYVRNMRDTSLWQDWNIHHVSTHRNGSIPERILEFAQGLGRFLYELTFRRPDIVHIHTSSYGSFARKLILVWTAKLYRIPVVMHVHGSRFHEFFDNAPKPVQLLIRTTLERADVVIALGGVWAARLQRIAPGASVYTEANTIRPDQPVSQLPAGPVHVVFLGEVGDRKGTFVLLAAWAKLLMLCDPTQIALTIAGDGDVDRARLMVDELDIQTSVDIRGWISETEVATLLADAQVLVLPSLNEGQPMAVLEGMARGICIVASDVGGIPEMLGPSGGILVHPGDVDELVAALDRVVHDSDLRTSLGGAALAIVQDDFNIGTTARRFDTMYRRIISGHNPVA